VTGDFAPGARWNTGGELEEAQGLLASGDISGLLRQLRAHGGALPLGEVARLVAEAARLAGFDDLAQAAAAVAGSGDGSSPRDARVLYDFGYACLERGAGYLAVRPLARALDLAPGPRWCSASSSRPCSRTASMRAPSRCSRRTNP